MAVEAVLSQSPHRGRRLFHPCAHPAKRRV